MASGHAEPYGKEGLSLEEARRHVLKTITLLDQPIAGWGTSQFAYKPNRI